MHNSCCITLCSSKKCEQAIIRDAKAKKQQRKYQHLRLNPLFILIHCRPPHYKKEHGYQQDSFTKKINAYGA